MQDTETHETGRQLTFIFKSSSCKFLYLRFRFPSFSTNYIDGYFGDTQRQSFLPDLATFITIPPVLTTYIISKSASFLPVIKTAGMILFSSCRVSVSILLDSPSPLIPHSITGSGSCPTRLPNLNLWIKKSKYKKNNLSSSGVNWAL